MRSFVTIYIFGFVYMIHDKIIEIHFLCSFYVAWT